MAHVANLYCMGGSSSVSSYEARGLATSVVYALGIADATAGEAARVLDVEDPIALLHARASTRSSARAPTTVAFM